MEFKTLKNIETSFRQIRFFTFVFICLCAGVTVVSVWASYNFAEKQRQKIYVLDQGKSLMLALSQDLAQNRPAEARAHIKQFHELFFTLSADGEAIKSNINRALFLADKSAYVYYKDLAEKGYFNRIISASIIQKIQVDSIICDFNTYPYAVTTYARQFIIRESTIAERSLITECNLLNGLRSDNNPHGFVIQQFQVKENKDIKSIER